MPLRRATALRCSGVILRATAWPIQHAPPLEPKKGYPPDQPRWQYQAGPAESRQTFFWRASGGWDKWLRSGIREGNLERRKFCLAIDDAESAGPRVTPSSNTKKGRLMVRFLHAADLHLGLRVTRFEESACHRVGEARFTALQQLRTKGAELKADFIVIAGDVFDDHSVSRTDAARAFPILESSANSCPVFIVPGNHDPLVPGGVWDRDPWLREQPHLRVRLLRAPDPAL
jgi:Calcineurin-like phosphoesterase